MNDIDRDTAANAYAPGYDGTAAVLDARLAALEALMGTGATADAADTQTDEPYYPALALGDPGVNRGGGPLHLDRTM